MATWLVYTDGVPHSVLSGQHALEQTFIISRKGIGGAAGFADWGTGETVWAAIRGSGMSLSRAVRATACS